MKVIIDTEEYFELVPKDKTVVWIPVSKIQDKQDIYLEIEQINIPDDMITSPGLIKELIKQKLTEIFAKNNLWCEK